jgi:DNA (cytosine-5)-methyltransferase 1
MIKVGSDFSGVGAFDQSLIKLGIEYKTIFACDMDKYARQTFIHNYGEPEYYPTNVYDRKIPSESLDIYMTSPPCQAFSLAGKRLGKDDKRGILFFNSHEFIQVNKPRYFIFENVKGLLSDDGGKTFQEWVNMLGGKSVNGVPVLFPYDESVPYHLYWKVLNAKHHGVPQNRERVFLIGIRDDVDNDFQFPKEEYLSKRLKDVLEDGVVDKYFLSEKMINYFDSRSSNFNNGNINFKDEESVASTITSSSKSLDISDNIIRLTNVNPSGNGMNGNVYGNEGISPTLSTNKGEGIKIGAFRGRNPDKPSDRTTGVQTEQRLEININGTSNTLTSVQKDNVVIENYKIRRLTPRECFRLMDFPDTFTWPVSDSQAYKQAGNSIVVNVLYKIIKNLKL